MCADPRPLADDAFRQIGLSSIARSRFLDAGCAAAPKRRGGVGVVLAAKGRLQDQDRANHEGRLVERKVDQSGRGMRCQCPGSRILSRMPVAAAIATLATAQRFFDMTMRRQKWSGDP